MANWYKEMVKKSGEFTSYVDSSFAPQDIANVREIKQWAPDGPQGAPGVTHSGLGLSKDKNYGKEIDRCGAEPGSKGGCGLSLEDYADWHDYSIKIGDIKYRAYRCKNCGHSLKPFNIEFSSRPEKYKKQKRTRKRHKRLSANVIMKMPKIAATPGSGSPGAGYNNPANSPYGRLDLNEDLRVIPWAKHMEQEENFNDYKQKNNDKMKVVKIIDKDGGERFVKVKIETTGGDGVSPANTYKEKGSYKKQTRYNPAKGKNKNDGHGAWPHNRDVNKGWYQSPQNELFNADLRQRYTPWDEYIRDRSTNLLTLTKPY